MKGLPIISGKECIKAPSKIGFYVRRQKGSHIIMRRDNPYAQVTVPNHKTLDCGTLHSIIQSAGMSVQEFNALLK